MSAPALKKCPAGKKPKLERLIGTGAGVIFKGSGFYETDYRSDAYNQAKKQDSESSTKSSTDSKAATDTSSSKPSDSSKSPSKDD